MKNNELAILEAVDALREDMLDFACRLVAQPSVLGQEDGALEVMASELSLLGYDPVRAAMDSPELAAHPGFAPTPWSQEGRYSLAATRPADGTGGKSALFNGHLDVVSQEPLNLWDRDPYDPLVKDGWLHGRGAGDMKGGVAAMTYALKAVERAGLGLAAPVTLEGVIEEECTGNGALACLVAGFDADAVLIPEPFGATILVSQVGVMWFKVSLSGVPKHALEASSGVNAIEMCCYLMAALRALEKEFNRDKGADFAHLENPAHLNIGVIQGGDWPSTVPAMAEFHCRLGFLPGTSFEQASQAVRRCLAQAARQDPWLRDNPPRVEFYGFRSQGHRVDRDQPALNLLGQCHQELSGQEAPSQACTCTTDLRAFIHYGRGQATCFGPVAQNIHAQNERVNIASMAHTAKVYALFLARWCGLVQ
ncbi:MAG: ArgE/DapE family deacylase [Proteobacteria bacterium]|nr:ArgE/DapE family deacylase [Pseudomonadota bacterium]MBU1451230.1 ArgE/DapE family deacylase [Pseudomonadota bacterium]MBU2470119.1 ArgE/DapE family deacylase [Pseudomonadota bacterium]MBU2516371.1 ArgE/DapE family deacylase [Pseudomonadota bacterium]